MCHKDIPFDLLEESCHAYLERLQGIHSGFDFPLIERAYRFAWNVHRDQKRRSGEPYILHPVAVSFILAKHNMDSTTIVATLLHDVIEDTDTSYAKIKELFGETVARLVDGVTKITSVHTDNPDAIMAETYRKMLLITAEDIRATIIKFADRLHNLRTLEYLPEVKRKGIARETLDIYAPLAQRLGMRGMKTELEDLSFRYLYPEQYEEIAKNISVDQQHSKELIESFQIPLKAALKEAGIEADVCGRAKHYYSIYTKFRDRKIPYDEIYDIFAMRVVCSTREECYRILGIIHSIWKPISDKLKDYIAAQKSNGYQSLHTTVIGSCGNFMEIQIRTLEMDFLAEEGVAAHWRYKDKTDVVHNFQDNHVLAWLRSVVEWQTELSDSVEFYEFFKIDISYHEIVVYTPQKHAHILSYGATVLDFAYAVHSDLGTRCCGGKVNGTLERRGKELTNGDVVEILTSTDTVPAIDWLSDVRTPKARSVLKRWLRHQEFQDRIVLGRRLLYGAYNHLTTRQPLSIYISEVLSHFGMLSENELYDRIGTAEIDLDCIVNFIRTRIRHSAPKVTRVMKALTRQKAQVMGDVTGNRIRYAPCCHPLLGDNIVGFLTNGRGIVVHRQDCKVAKLFISVREKNVHLSWDELNQRVDLTARITVKGTGDGALLSGIIQAALEEHVAMSEMKYKKQNTQVRVSLKLELNSVSKLQQLKQRIRGIPGVAQVSRDRDLSE